MSKNYYQDLIEELDRMQGSRTSTVGSYRTAQVSELELGGLESLSDEPSSEEKASADELLREPSTQNILKEGIGDILSESVDKFIEENREDIVSLLSNPTALMEAIKSAFPIDEMVDKLLQVVQDNDLISKGIGAVFSKLLHRESSNLNHKKAWAWLAPVAKFLAPILAELVLVWGADKIKEKLTEDKTEVEPTELSAYVQKMRIKVAQVAANKPQLRFPRVDTISRDIWYKKMSPEQWGQIANVLKDEDPKYDKQAQIVKIIGPLWTTAWESKKRYTPNWERLAYNGMNNTIDLLMASYERGEIPGIQATQLESETREENDTATGTGSYETSKYYGALSSRQSELKNILKAKDAPTLVEWIKHYVISEAPALQQRYRALLAKYSEESASTFIDRVLQKARPSASLEDRESLAGYREILTKTLFAGARRRIEESQKAEQEKAEQEKAAPVEQSNSSEEKPTSAGKKSVNVQPGWGWGHIAKQLYGDPQLWPHLQKANPEIKILHPGKVDLNVPPLASLKGEKPPATDSKWLGNQESKSQQVDIKKVEFYNSSLKDAKANLDNLIKQWNTTKDPAKKKQIVATIEKTKYRIKYFENLLSKLAQGSTAVSSYRTAQVSELDLGDLESSSDEPSSEEKASADELLREPSTQNILKEGIGDILSESVDKFIEENREDIVSLLSNPTALMEAIKSAFPIDEMVDKLLQVVQDNDLISKGIGAVFSKLLHRESSNLNHKKAWAWLAPVAKFLAPILAELVLVWGADKIKEKLTEDKTEVEPTELSAYVQKMRIKVAQRSGGAWDIQSPSFAGGELASYEASQQLEKVLPYVEKLMTLVQNDPPDLTELIRYGTYIGEELEKINDSFSGARMGVRSFEDVLEISDPKVEREGRDIWSLILDLSPSPNSYTNPDSAFEYWKPFFTTYAKEPTKLAGVLKVYRRWLTLVQGQLHGFYKSWSGKATTKENESPKETKKKIAPEEVKPKKPSRPPQLLDRTKKDDAAIIKSKSFVEGDRMILDDVDGKKNTYYYIAGQGWKNSKTFKDHKQKRKVSEIRAKSQKNLERDIKKFVDRYKELGQPLDLEKLRQNLMRKYKVKDNMTKGVDSTSRSPVASIVAQLGLLRYAQVDPFEKDLSGPPIVRDPTNPESQVKEEQPKKKPLSLEDGFYEEFLQDPKKFKELVESAGSSPEDLKNFKVEEKEAPGKTRTVKLNGRFLAQVAKDEYKDWTKWPIIATENNIKNPDNVPEMSLKIPPLRALTPAEKQMFAASAAKWEAKKSKPTTQRKEKAPKDMQKIKLVNERLLQAIERLGKLEQQKPSNPAEIGKAKKQVADLAKHLATLGYEAPILGSNRRPTK